MDTPKGHILLIESDPQISEVIAQQTLRPLGYRVDVFESASHAINDINKISPDIIITNLHLPDISGKDLLVALNSQEIKIPVIVITPRGHESDALQAFRLGASNFLSDPIREAEVVTVVEDTFSQLRKQQDLDYYSQQLDQTKREIKHLIHDYTEIFSIGKLASSSENMQPLFEKLIKTVTGVTRADTAWLLVLDPANDKFIMRACSNTNKNLHLMLNLTYENSLTTLVATSGQTISIHGDAAKRFKLIGIVGSVLVVPIKHSQEVVGMLAAERKTPLPFNNYQKVMLELIAEYTEIFIENSKRFQKLEQNCRQLQQSSVFSRVDSDLKSDLLYQTGKELHNLLNDLNKNLDNLWSLSDRKYSPKQTQMLNLIKEEINILMDTTDSIIRIPQEEKINILEKTDLNEMVRNAVNRLRIIAQVDRIDIKLELPLQPTHIMVYTSQITKVIEGIISNALKYSPPKSQIKIRLENKDNYVLILVNDQGEGISEHLAESLFDKKTPSMGNEGMRFGGIGISLPMMKEIITAHHGEIWIDNKHKNGFTVIFSLPQLMIGKE
jgi:K+-sensing histidine kinase KdpD